MEEVEEMSLEEEVRGSGRGRGELRGKTRGKGEGGGCEQRGTRMRKWNR